MARTKPIIRTKKYTLEYTKDFCDHLSGVYLIDLIRNGRRQIKVGQSGNLKQRIRTYGRYKIFNIWSFKIKNKLEIERKIKQKMGENFKRINLDNEFFVADFQGSLKIVKEVLGLIEVPVVPVVPVVNNKRKNVDSMDEPPSKRLKYSIR
jgi:hypothetical protein